MIQRVGYPAKRARTHRALVRGAMELLAQPGNGRGPHTITVASVCKAAGVSNGTFYNYFDSVEDLLAAVTADLGQVFELGAQNLSQLSGDPAGRVALGVLQVLAMPDEDPTYARAFVRMMATRADFRTRVRALVEAEVAKGVSRGIFHTRSQAVATDALLGAVLQVLRSMLLGESHDDRAGVVEVAMRLLGLPADEVEAVTDRAMIAHQGA